MHRRILAGLLVLGCAAGVGSQVAPPGTGLAGYWTLNDATDPVALETSGVVPANNGAYVGTALPTTSPLVPQAGGLAHPPGNTASRVFTQATNGQRVQVPHAAVITPTGSFTVAAWVRPAGAQPENMGIVEKHSGGPISGFFLRMSPAMAPRICVGDGTASPELGTGTPLTANVWSHLAATYDAGTSTLRLYVNGGTPVSMGGVAAPAANTAALHIGADYGINRFSGNIDDVRLYDRRLLDAEVGVLVNGLAAPVISSLTPGPGTVDVGWAAVPNATSYRVFQGSSATGPWTLVGTPTANSFTDSSVVNPTQYWYQVVAVGLLESYPSAAQGPVVPQSLVPRTEGHEEGLFDDNCACGSTASGAIPTAGLWLAAALFLARRRR
jgi:hypothetical protein